MLPDVNDRAISGEARVVTAFGNRKDPPSWSR
jgi:hypothetical protein